MNKTSNFYKFMHVTSTVFFKLLKYSFIIIVGLLTFLADLANDMNK